MDSTARTTINDAADGTTISLEHYRVLFDRAPYAIAMLDKDGLAVRVNEEFCRLFQFEENACIGKQIEALIKPETRESERLAFSAKAMLSSCVAVEARCMSRDGTPVDVSILSKPIDIASDEPAVYIIFQDISGRQKKEEALRYVAYHDALTGLINRYEFERRLKNVISEQPLVSSGGQIPAKTSPRNDRRYTSA